MAIVNQASIIPSLPRSPVVVDERGMMKPEYRQFFQQLTQALQTHFNPEGFLFPPQSAANIANLTGAASLGSILYDSTNNAFRANILTAPSTYTWTTIVTI